jgi:hypothetical protein
VPLLLAFGQVQQKEKEGFRSKKGKRGDGKIEHRKKRR